MGRGEEASALPPDSACLGCLRGITSPPSPSVCQRGKRQEVRQRLGTQLQQPRAVSSLALGLWGRGSPGRKARATSSQRGPRGPSTPPPAILPSDPQHHGSSSGTILRLWAFGSLTLASEEALLHVSRPCLAHACIVSAIQIVLASALSSSCCNLSPKLLVSKSLR